MTSQPHENIDSGRPLRTAIVGAGRRSAAYAAYALAHPDEMTISAVVEPDSFRLDLVAEQHRVPMRARFRSVQEMLQRADEFDAAVVAVADREVVPATLQLLNARLHVLLEKPITAQASEIAQLHATARRTGRVAMISHVLRYSPFFAEIRRRIASGDLGQIVSIQSAEYINYSHLVTAFVRGRSSRKDRSASFLMTRSSHDLDLVVWLKSGIVPQRVSSQGALMQFCPANAPAGSGTRCLLDCSIEPQCPYSAKRLYVDNKLFSSLAWTVLANTLTPTKEQKLQSLRTDNPYGRCVWRCDNTVVDHQGVIVQFADGSTATHNLFAGAIRGFRKIHVVGTLGEIQGTMEDGRFTLRRPEPEASDHYSQKVIEAPYSSPRGDSLLVADFVRMVRGQAPSASATGLDDSIYGHLLTFAADEAMEQNRGIEIRPLEGTE